MVIRIDNKYYKGMGVVVWRAYSNKRIAILLESLMGEPLFTATVNIPEAILGKDEVLIKNWSENEGVLATLVNAGVVEGTGKKVPTGFVKANVCRLLVQPK